ncbi:MAG: hydrogenase formation protein HypD [Candidatus Cloacimonetes bacterium]|jgi:hydrogenase expression/formation protein HypD|nr:hydrogenase formation protein HypD [Candidatus Cloacimonadota bacterium]MBT4332982.1 hydrogenase formation protein HypD [Candidatus Cloacimonadota bacterium]MBT4575852.1 hydrogenase formation protein HypD [Candidatus Cloacimonadota bacterium]MBT5419774.1 hydrogenase formation protein HypD [Candidatus Cloacimonadota bacterium]
MIDLTKFRDPKLIKKIVSDLQKWEKPTKIMEVCGSHTMAIGHWGIRKLLPDNISLISGPGCPVCVTPSSLIDELVKLENVTIATFGDVIRVPGKDETLEHARARGLDVKIVYSPLEALELSKEKETIFVGIGFETTVPGIAQTILMAKKQQLNNFSVFPAFKLVPPALEALLSADDIKLDGFLLPGHVSVIIGSESYMLLPEKYGIGGVVSGFEPLDILSAIKIITEQVKSCKPAIVNEYNRVVNIVGNKNAQKVIDAVLEVEDALWRGIGWIPNSGLGIREEFKEFDASKKYNIKLKEEEGNTGCKCADVLKGIIIPPECPLFEKTCNPAHPIGPCMVSSEGSCAAYYRYER